MSSKKPIRIYVCHPFETYGDIETNLKSENALVNYLKTMARENVEFVRPFTLVPNSYSRDEAMKMCFELIDSCEIVLLCPMWQFSKGCNEEVLYAIEKGKDIIEQSLPEFINYDLTKRCLYEESEERTD